MPQAQKNLTTNNAAKSSEKKGKPLSTLALLDLIYHPVRLSGVAPSSKGVDPLKTPKPSTKGYQSERERLFRTINQVAYGKVYSSSANVKEVFGPTRTDIANAHAGARKQLKVTSGAGQPSSQSGAFHSGFSKGVRDYVNDGTEYLSQRITPYMPRSGLVGYFMPELEANVVSGILTTPVQIAAEMDTIADPGESGKNKAGAAINIALQTIPFDQVALKGIEYAWAKALAKSSKGEAGALVNFFGKLYETGIDVERLLGQEKPPVQRNVDNTGPLRKEAFIAPEIATHASHGPSKSQAPTTFHLANSPGHPLATKSASRSVVGRQSISERALAEVGKVGRAMRKAGIPRHQVAALSVPLYQQIRFALEHDPAGFLFGAKAVKRAPKTGLRQIEDIILNPDPIDRYPAGKGTLVDAANYIQKFAENNPVFSKPVSLLSDKEFVNGIVAHTNRELSAWTKVKEGYRDFFGSDITDEGNRMLQEFAIGRYGSALTEAELKLYHLVSSLASPATTPEFDSMIGLKIFDRWKRTGTLSGYGDRQATVWQRNSRGQKVDTGVLRFDKFGTPIPAKVSPGYATNSLRRVAALVKEMGVSGAMDWLGSHHSAEEIRHKVGGYHLASSSEYLGSEGGFGIFGVMGPKLGSYTLNRWQEFGTITKDMWFARTMARLTGEPLVVNGKVVNEPWGLTKADLRKRRLLDEACGKVAQSTGMTPAGVAQAMWDLEHMLYTKLGGGNEPKFISDGIRKGVGSFARGNDLGEMVSSVWDEASANAGRVSRDVEPSLVGDGRASSGRKVASSRVITGSFDPRTKVVSLVKGKAHVSTAIHEISGHWFETVLRNHPEYGPILKKHYGDIGSEKFARHVEAYFRTGKAPIKELRTVFAAIKEWMRDLIGRAHYGPMPKEVQSIFNEVHSYRDRHVDNLIAQFELSLGQTAQARR